MITDADDASSTPSSIYTSPSNVVANFVSKNLSLKRLLIASAQ